MPSHHLSFNCHSHPCDHHGWKCDWRVLLLVMYFWRLASEYLYHLCPLSWRSDVFLGCVEEIYWWFLHLALLPKDYLDFVCWFLEAVLLVPGAALRSLRHCPLLEAPSVVPAVPLEVPAFLQLGFLSRCMVPTLSRLGCFRERLWIEFDNDYELPWIYTFDDTQCEKPSDK